ncbi:MAG: hypothetical protein ABI759_11565 [Candidatus Solibacter sp.]
MAILGVALFVLMFALMIPQCQAFLFATADNALVFVRNWAPLSYIVIAVIVVGPIAAMYLVHTWPRRVEPESPMAKFRRELPSADED